MLTNYDVIIVGAGSAGIGAGASAIEAGLKTLIIHEDSYLGGQATNIYVGTVCGIHTRFDGKDDLVSNFAREFTRNLAKKSGTKSVINKIGLTYLPYTRESFIELSSEVLNSRHLKIEGESKVKKVNVDNNKIQSIEIENKHLSSTISAPYFIDCSGNGILSALANGRLIKEEEYQHTSLVVGLSGIEERDEEVLKLNLYKTLEEGFRSKKIPVNGRCLNFVTGTTSTYSDQIYLKFKSLRSNISFEQEILELHETLNFLRAEKMFSSIKITFTSSSKGIRSSSRPLGVSVLSDEMVINCQKSNKSIARGLWPVELWKGQNAPIIEHLKKDSFYDIPLTCLQSASFNNLFSAGRALSSEEKAHSSARVIGTCLQTGHASGYIVAKLLEAHSIEDAVQKYQISAGFN